MFLKPITAKPLPADPKDDGSIRRQDINDIGGNRKHCRCPAKPKWCELRKIVFSWTHPKFPFRVSSGRKLTITEPRIITVTGKAFFDVNHASADQSNRRTDLQGYAAWEIHPVMRLDVKSD